MSALPRLIVIADGFAGGGVRHGGDVWRAVGASVRAGRIWVHLRDHEAPPESVVAAARAWTAAVRAHAPETVVSVNARRGAAMSFGAGLHVGWRGPSLAEARAAGAAPLSAAAHGLDEAIGAEAAGADAVLYSPVYPTASKPGHAGAGLGALAAVCRSVAIPVYALGGVTPPRATACRRAGAYGVAVLSGVLDAADPAAATAAYLSALADAPR